MNVPPNYVYRRSNKVMDYEKFEMPVTARKDYDHWLTKEGMEGSNVLIAAPESRKVAMLTDKQGSTVDSTKKIMNPCQDSLNIYRGNVR